MAKANEVKQNGMIKIIKFKYNSNDYLSISFYLDDVEKKYREYILSNKDDIKLIFLKEAINGLRSGLKSAVILKEISQEEADETLDYYWDFLDSEKK